MKGRRPAVVAGAAALAAAAIIALVAVLVRDTGPGGTTAGTVAVSTGGTTPAPPQVPPDLPPSGDFPGAPPDLTVPSGGAAAIAPGADGQEVTLQRADGTPAAVVTLGPGGAPRDARYYDRAGRLTVVVSALRASAAGATAARPRVRCGSSARADAGFRWTRFPVRWRLSSTPPPNGLRRAPTLQAIRRARGVWNATRSHCAGLPDASRARFTFVGSSPRRLGRDGVSLVDVGDIRALGGICPGAVACTVTWISGGNRATESDTRIARSDPGGFSTARRPGRRKLDVQTVMVHESGHTLGFAHVSAQTVVMNPIVRRGDVSGRLLGRGDALASNAKY